MAVNIRNTGQLREHLARILEALQKGNIKVDEARTALKVAEKINESFYAELKVATVSVQLGRKADELGALPIGERE